MKITILEKISSFREVSDFLVRASPISATLSTSLLDFLFFLPELIHSFVPNFQVSFSPITLSYSVSDTIRMLILNNF